MAPSSGGSGGGGGLPAGITADTVFGEGQVGGSIVDPSIKALFWLVKPIVVKVQLLNTGISLKILLLHYY